MHSAQIVSFVGDVCAKACVHRGHFEARGIRFEDLLHAMGEAYEGMGLNTGRNISPARQVEQGAHVSATNLTAAQEVDTGRGRA